MNMLVNAAAAAATSTAIADVGANPDAELLELGAELESIIQEWHAKRAIDERNRAVCEAAWERAGLPQREPKDFPNVREWRKYQDKRIAVAEQAVPTGEVDENGCDAEWTSIHDRMFPLCEQIMTCRPTTIAGLAVMARAVSLTESDHWEEWEDEGRLDRAFIEAVCTFAGVTAVPLEAVRV